MKPVITALIMGIGLACGADAAQQTVCGQYDAVSCNGYTFRTNVWNPMDWNWTQCLTTFCDTNHSWRASWSITNGGEVQSWPDISFRGTDDANFPYLVSSYRPTYVTWLVDSVANPGGTGLDIALDIWTNPSKTYDQSTHACELMIWLGKLGTACSPSGSVVERDTICGLYWIVLTGKMNNWNIINFVHSTAGTAAGNLSRIDNLNISEFYKVAVRLGSANANHYVSCIEAGFEVWGGPAGYAKTGRFKVAWGNMVNLGPQQAKTETGAANTLHRQSARLVCMKNRPALSTGSSGTLFDIRGKELTVRQETVPAVGVYIQPATSH
jgi:hypothetical protein